MSASGVFAASTVIVTLARIERRVMASVGRQAALGGGVIVGASVVTAFVWQTSNSRLPP